MSDRRASRILALPIVAILGFATTVGARPAHGPLDPTDHVASARSPNDVALLPAMKRPARSHGHTRSVFILPRLMALSVPERGLVSAQHPTRPRPRSADVLPHRARAPPVLH